MQTFLLGAMGLTLTLAACDDSIGVKLPSFEACQGDICLPDAALDAQMQAPDGCESQGERCDGADNDCDGKVDESFPEAGECGLAVGGCQAGVRACVAGSIVCEGAGEPVDEICNDIDDDCDGTTDESAAIAAEACGPADVCGPAPAECMAGQVVCLPRIEPEDETCNGRDDDCDGTTDEALPAADGIGQPCGSATGICRPGLRACVAGALLCEGESPPAPELCNSLDDDCNGTVDDAPTDAGQPCGEGELCAAALTVCEAGVLRCEGGMARSDERCNGVDDDCDGEIDEADPMLGTPCGIEAGACTPGEIRCVAATLFCFGGTSPTDESCDGEDNDCDGETDEADDVHGGAPCPGLGDVCESHDQCGPDRRCVDDFGQRYCTPTCDAQDECEAGFTCRALGQSTVCRRDFSPCLSDAECEMGELCMLIGGARDPDRLGAECRPAIPGGLPLNGDCAPDGAVCASNLCLGPMDRCSGLCDASVTCGDDSVCIRTPFVIGNGSVVEVGLCLQACNGDAICDPAGTDRFCQYDLATGVEGVLGHCDARREGGAVGSACDLSADPPLTCDHGFCRRDDLGRYCTQGCGSDADCLIGWLCTPTPFRTDAGEFSVGICERP